MWSRLSGLNPESFVVKCLTKFRDNENELLSVTVALITDVAWKPTKTTEWCELEHLVFRCNDSLKADNDQTDITHFENSYI